MRLTYRTVRVLLAIGQQPGASNRHVAEAAGILDQGQTSKLLRRLAHLGLVENASPTDGQRGEPNAWQLTTRGERLRETIGARPAGDG
jgi:DNA-binding MarR family transcriptional regulator